MKIGRRGDIESGPVIRMAPAPTHGTGGIECCYIRWCTCIHLEFIKSWPGVLKVLETIISGLIESLLINYGLRYSATIGTAFEGALTTASASFFTTSILLACYVVSERSYRLIRATIFEMCFNGLSCFFYLSAAVYLGLATKLFLWPFYELTGGFDVYPAMTTAYMLSGIVGLLYGADALHCLKEYRRQR